MKFEDLQKIAALEVCEYTGNTLHLHCKEGYFLTDFTGDDYLKYTDFFCTFLPIKEEYQNYQVITIKQHNDNLDKRKKAIEEKIEKDRVELENKRYKEMEEDYE